MIPAAGSACTGQPDAAALLTASSFQRRHLVMRLDPVWGEPRIAELAEADTFHWSNCAPQHQRLNGTWWHAVERHVLSTADVTDQRVSVFAGPVLHPRDPVLRGVRRAAGLLRSVPPSPGGRARLGCARWVSVVRQDAEVRAGHGACRADRRRAHQAGFPGPAEQGACAYQAAVGVVQALTGLHFGQLANEHVDVSVRACPRR